ncbi:restriction endonuclease subunit S [Phocaeicola dorei]|jgi:type I restriction enzyme S subunit|uniref:restriction endonuclease subunit S n=1 Tax=Phocaeicola TaxID=909656 RepID=UPI00104C3440|nr:restriction endonuclease subunit S [Phocaeicola dorei]MBT1286307.1 restriction endonuclease subunit S [Phocaeicola dorei]MBT1290038.1 restriction endonuclease subunit S [Phocaeicola dorei]MBV3580998.1 restriction endonuclease subunit S [Phocaeicola dorei]QJR73641.1 restriction endonuclease subunit S [Phocaeicola dorei]QUT85288.1 Type-1 restriction enzyme EcoKI specificity protein [Phocaeicola dorei]
MSNTWFRLRRGFFLSFFPSDTPHYENVPFEVPNSWVWCRLEDIAYVASGSTPDKTCFVENGVPYIKMYNLRNQKIDFAYHPQYITEEVHNGKLQRSRTEVGDLIMNIVGPPLGKLAIIPTTLPQANFNQAAILIRPYKFKEVLVSYLKVYLEEMSEINSIATRGSAGQVNISLTQSQNMRIPIPPLNEVRRIIEEVSKYDILIDSLKQNITDIQNLIAYTKSKIFDLAIHGKLVPQDPNDEPAIELLKRINPEFTPCDNGHYTQLPEGWAICKMKQITSITNGKSQKNVETLNGIYPIYGSGGVIGRANQYLCIAGSTIIGRKGTINNPIFVEEHFWNVDTAFGLKANDAILDKYLYYFCLSFDFSKLDKSTAMPSLTKTSIGNVLIPIPPYKEQERIVAKIDMVLDTMNEILRAV